VKAPAAAVLVLGLTLVACGSEYSGSTVAQQVQSWVRSSPDPKFAAVVSTLEGDFRKTSEAESLGDQALVRTTCDVLVTDALSANQNLPTPDTELTDLLSAVYGSAVSSGQDCFCAAGGRPCARGASTHEGFLQRSRREASAALRGIVKADARVDQLTIVAGGGSS
jgi:hypothetical protein